MQTVCLRREEAPTPTGSQDRDTKPVGSPTGIQHGRDKQMVECADVDVQRTAAAVISAASCGSLAMMERAPQASRRFAQSLTVTKLVML